MTTCCTPATTTAPAAPDAAQAESQARKPRYAVQGSDQAYTIQVELPGVAKENVTIDYDADVLTIKGRRESTVPAAWKPLHRELNDQSYVLRLRLNAPVDETRLTAQLADGVLAINLPVREAAKPRRIEVN